MADYIKSVLITRKRFQNNISEILLNCDNTKPHHVVIDELNFFLTLEIS